jgi:hypothetical protein
MSQLRGESCAFSDDASRTRNGTFDRVNDNYLTIRSRLLLETSSLPLPAEIQFLNELLESQLSDIYEDRSPVLTTRYEGSDCRRIIKDYVRKRDALLKLDREFNSTKKPGLKIELHRRLMRASNDFFRLYNVDYTCL